MKQQILKLTLVTLLLLASFGIGIHPSTAQGATPGTTLNAGLNRFATIPSLNPYSPVYVNPIDSEMYLRCVHVDDAPAKHFTNILCTSETAANNYTSWTMNLMSGLKWSDGSPLNATDLQWSLIDGNATGYFSPYLTSVKVLNSTAVTAIVPYSQPNWLENMENIFIVPHESFNVPLSSLASFTDFTNIVGAGPYILPSYTAGTNPLLMVPNQYYYLGNNQYYAQVAVHIFSSLTSMESAMLAGQIDIMWYGGTGQSTGPFNGANGIGVYVRPTPANYQILNLNYLKAPLNTVAFRQGLAYATDRNAISQTVNGPGYTLINYGGGPSVASGENTYSFNTTLAKQMFVQAGMKYSSGGQLQYTNGTQVTLTIEVPTGEPDSANIASLAAQQWANVGIHVLTDTVEATSLYAAFGSGAWQIASLQEDGTTGNPIRYTDQLQSSGLSITTVAATPGTPATAGQFVTRQIGNLILNQSLVPTGSTAYNAITDQLTPLVANQVVMIPLYTESAITVYNNKISFGTNATDPNQSTGIYNYQTDVQAPYADTTFYYVHPLSAGTSTTTSSATTTSSSKTGSTGSSTTTITTTTTATVTTTPSTTSSSSSSTSLSNYIFPVVAITALVLAVTGILASSKRRSQEFKLGNVA
ncbi:MAG: ABC transporter substrate-binding protein [Thaumarchaeota archaeon]|nr:ABC transporter substrate-binding protein [Nitrososphaerota archaeon]